MLIRTNLSLSLSLSLSGSLSLSLVLSWLISNSHLDEDDGNRLISKSNQASTS